MDRNAESPQRRRAIAAAAVLVVAFVPLALALEPAPAPAQEAESPSELDRALAMHYEARGGLDTLRGMKTARATGTLDGPGGGGAFTIEWRRPGQMRFVLDFPNGLSLVQGFDGEQAWLQQPGRKPAALEGDEAATIAADAVTSAPWFEFTDLASVAGDAAVEFAGREPLSSGGEAWKLAVAGPNGPVHFHLDTEDGLLKRRVSTGAFGLGETTIAFEDYRQSGGAMIAHRELRQTGIGLFTLTVDSVEVDPEIDPDVFFLPGQTADPALDLDEVLTRHEGARGAAAGEVETMRAEGSVVMLGFEVPMTVAFARPSSFRIDIDLQGLTMILARDGETAWTVSPMQGIVDPAPLPEETKGAVEILSDFLWGMLANREERGLEAALAGIAKVERDETYRLELADADGERRTLHLGGEDFLERRVVFDGAFLGSTGEIDVTLADYSEVGGLKVPGKIRIAVEGQVAAELRIDSAEVGVEIDAASFAMPAPADPVTPGPGPR